MRAEPTKAFRPMDVFPFCLNLLITTALFVNELYGPALLAVSLAVMTIMFAAHPKVLFATVARSGVLLWLVFLLLFLSTFWSEDPAITLRASVQVGLTILLAICVCGHTRPIHLVQSINLVCAVIVVASLISGRQGIDGMTGAMNLVGITSNKNTLSSYAGLLVLTSITILMTAQAHGVWKAAALLGTPVGFLTCLRSYSVAAISITIIAVAIMLAINVAQFLPKRKRRQYIEQMVVLGFVLAPSAAIFFSFFWDDALRLVGKEPTLTGRTVLWFYADRFSKDHYFFGIGFGDFWVQGKSAAEMLWRMLHIKSRSGFHFHNIYYQFAVELGLAGVVLLVLYQISVLYDAAKAVLLRADSISAFLAAVVIFVTIEEFQGVALFQTFSPLFFTCIVCAIYARMAGYRATADAPFGHPDTGAPHVAKRLAAFRDAFCGPLPRRRPRLASPHWSPSRDFSSEGAPRLKPTARAEAARCSRAPRADAASPIPQHVALEEACARLTAESEVTDDLLQPRGASRESGQDAARKALGEDLPPSGSCVAPEASYEDLELDLPATSGRPAARRRWRLSMRREGVRQSVQVGTAAGDLTT